jgi:hypothetical protein
MQVQKYNGVQPAVVVGPSEPLQVRPADAMLMLTRPLAHSAKHQTSIRT